MFVFLTAKLSGRINESSFTAAALIELLHTATLVHDDVVDEWRGTELVLFVDPNVKFGHKKVGGIRCRAPKNQPGNVPETTGGSEIPF